MTVTTAQTNPKNAPRTSTSHQGNRRAKAVKLTKKARLISFLSTKNGADVATISKNLGWLPHTTRAALTGLRKAGYEITSIKPGSGKPSRYQIIAMPDADAA